MADEKDTRKNDTDRTHVGPARPPGAPQTSVPPPARDDTSVGVAPPPPLPKPAPHTEPSPQPGPPPEAAPPAPTPGAPKTPEPREPAAFADEEKTVIIPKSARQPCSLQRLAPPGRGADMIRLNADSYVLGRSSDADIPLFSPTASRRHALLLRREGEWFLQPEESKLVIAAGTPVVKEIRLTHKMRLQLGDDELLFFDARPSAAATERPATDRTPEPKAGEQSNAFLGVVILVILAVVAAAIWMLLGH